MSPKKPIYYDLYSNCKQCPDDGTCLLIDRNKLKEKKKKRKTEKEKERNALFGLTTKEEITQNTHPSSVERS